MRLVTLTLGALALVALAAACGGPGKVKMDDVASCMEDSGKFAAVMSGDKGQIRYAGSQGGVQATYTGAQPVTVNVLIGQDSGEASNLQSNLSESGVFVDATRVRNAVYAIPVDDKDSPNRSAAGAATKDCL
jgi:hypothetical protein